jgi:nitroreductase
MIDDTIAVSDHPVHELIGNRYSPYVYDDRPVSEDDLKSLFEAARWTASSYNEQPWRYIVATRANAKEYERLLSCLVEGNQEWARQAPVLALGVVKTTLTRNDKPNRVALHDLGAASASLTLEATSRGLAVHQMGGILPEKAREVYGVPDGYEVVTGMAIGYAGAADDSALGQRDRRPRKRRPVTESVFTGRWENPAF